MDSNCLIITGGENVKKDTLFKIASQNSFIICVDKGGEIAYKNSIKIDVILGDFDSIDKKVLEKLNAKIVKFPVDKDFTDTELAISYAVELGFKNITIINATGNRIDHVFSTFMLLYKFRKINIKIVGDNFHAFLIDKNYKIMKNAGKTISLIPLSEDIKDITLRGFKYNLTNKLVHLGDSLCTSNVIVEDIATIKFKEGIFLIIITELEE